MHWLEGVAPAALSVFFVEAAYLNLNDPDAALWVTVYSVAAAICVQTVFTVWNRRRRPCSTVPGGNSLIQLSSKFNQPAAEIHGILCGCLTIYSLALATARLPPKEPPETILLNGDGGAGHEAEGGREAAARWIVFVESEPAREAAGSLIMVFAMSLCAATSSRQTAKGAQRRKWARWEAAGTHPDEKVASIAGGVGSISNGGLIWVALFGVVLAVVATIMGLIIPEYLNGVGVSLPKHCGGV
ncbi:unnamed protein product [Discosporangium mesarthrocarpum]